MPDTKSSLQLASLYKAEPLDRKMCLPLPLTLSHTCHLCFIITDSIRFWYLRGYPAWGLMYKLREWLYKKKPLARIPASAEEAVVELNAALVGKMCSWAPMRMHTHPRPAKPSAGRGSCLSKLDWAPKRERTILHSWHCSPLMSAHAETGQRGCKKAFSSEFWWGSLSPVLKLWITQSAEGKKQFLKW